MTRRQLAWRLQSLADAARRGSGPCAGAAGRSRARGLAGDWSGGVATDSPADGPPGPAGGGLTLRARGAED
jgi:hypothetical protein